MFAALQQPDLMIRIIEDGTHQNIEADIGPDIGLAVILLHGMHRAEKQAAFGGQITSRLTFKMDILIVITFDKRIKNGEQLSAQSGEIQPFLILTIGDAETAAEIVEIAMDAGYDSASKFSAASTYGSGSRKREPIC